MSKSICVRRMNNQPLALISSVSNYTRKCYSYCVISSEIKDRARWFGCVIDK